MNKAQEIEILIKALGTMVIFPVEESNPNEIGKKTVVGTVQRPILEGSQRDKVTAKLLELVDSLKA